MSNVDLKSISSDASRIYISEKDKIDNESFYQVSNVNKHIKVMSNEDLPSILLKSNNVRIVSREKSSAKNEELKEGSIRLVKESNNFENYAHIAMESDGDIFLDGKNIFIGNAKERVNQEIVSICETENSEPVVLGKKLEEKLNKIIELNIKTLDAVSALSQELSTHAHLPPVTVSSPTGIPLPAPANNFISISTESNAIISDFNKIKEELKEFLSVYVKTS